jgi:hypothetical protein
LQVSDRHKDLLLSNPGTLYLLTLGLFLDPQNPRGANAVPPASPTSEDVQAACQLTCVEALQQLALYTPGQEAILRDTAAVESLEELAERGGLTKEATELAAVALLALSDKELVRATEGQRHVMLSCECEALAAVIFHSPISCAVPCRAVPVQTNGITRRRSSA